MSDNDVIDYDDKDWDDDIDQNVSLKDLGMFEDAAINPSSFASGERRKVLLTTMEERRRLKELLRIHQWANVNQSQLPQGESFPPLHDVSPMFKLWKRVGVHVNVKRSVLNLYAAGLSVFSNGWGFEQFLVLLICMTSTLAYSLAPAPESPHLASQLDFHYLATSLVYLVSFGAQQTLGRRDAALQYLSMIRSLSCQMTLALLLWNRDRPRPTDDFADRVVNLFQRGVYHCFCVLRIPTWNRTRHYFTPGGKAFRRAMKRRLYYHRKKFTQFMFELHEILEEVKASGAIEGHETTRLTEWTRMLNTQVEQIQLVKEYRTTNIARSYIRVFMLLCPAMYGVYFSYIAGNVEGGSATTGLPYSVFLMMCSICLLLMMINAERSLEDPCTTEYPGDMINLSEELKDLCERLEMIHDYCDDEWREKLHPRYRRRGADQSVAPDGAEDADDELDDLGDDLGIDYDLAEVY